MSLTLCMLVKNEFVRIERCIDSVKDCVDEFLITDTGSSDGTPELLKEKYGIPVSHGNLEEGRCLCKQDLRNRNFAAVKTDWILSLDADEVLVGNLPQALAFLQNNFALIDGGFARWRNELPDQPAFDDYKLFLFKKNFRSRGLIHENAQLDIRGNNGSAVWLDQFWVRHLPDPLRLTEKRDLYMQRLQCAIALEPEWLRYYWFMGYMHFLAHDFDLAEKNLKKCGFLESSIFPVERLNSLMVLSDIYAQTNRPKDLEEVLYFAKQLWISVRDDFEVKINIKLGVWIDKAQDALIKGDLGMIRAYRFGS